MGGQSFECQMCHKWFLYPGARWEHVKAKHRESRHSFANAQEILAYDRGFTRGFNDLRQELGADFPQAYARGYWEGVYVADPQGAKE